MNDRIQEGSQVTVAREIPDLDDWEEHRDYYYKNERSGREVHEQVYERWQDEIEVLSKYLEEVE